MTRVGRPILIALLFLPSVSFLGNGGALAQIFESPEIPRGQTIGDLSGSTSGASTFVPSPMSSGQPFDDAQSAQSVPRFDTSAGEAVDSVKESGTMVFGPVDGAVPTISREDSWSGAAEFNGGESGYSQPQRSVETRETSARRSKADIGEMRGREIIRQRYPDGNVQIARHVKQDQGGNYVNDGQWQLFDREGIRIAMGTYVDGAMEGQWARLHQKSDGGIFLNPPFSLFQGPFTSRATFANGKLSGEWRITDAKGRKVFEMPYVDGKRDGLALWFYPGDKVFRRMQFANNVPDGQLIQFDQRGKTTRKEIYQDGKRIEKRVTYYRPSNQKQEAKIVLRGRLELNGEDQWWDAKPAALIVAGEDSEQGPIRSWYKNGQTKMVGNLEDGARVGRFVWWHENGVKQSMGTYDARGQKTGQWVWWHKNGMKSIMGQYKNDEPDGEWREWDEDGKQVREKTFDADAEKGFDDDSVSLFRDDVDRGESIDIQSSDDAVTDATDGGEDGSMESMINDNSDPAPDPAPDSNQDRESGSGGTESLEDISPAEMEGEELPSPGASADDDSSASQLQRSGKSADDDVDRFFQIGF